MRTPFFKDHPTFRPPAGRPLRRVLFVLAPTEADVVSVKASGRELVRLGVEVATTSECHGEVRGERGEPLFPNLLLVEAVAQPWDAVVVGGGRGAQRVAEDLLARQFVARVAKQEKSVAALGQGRALLEREGIPGLVTDDPRVLVAWLVKWLGLSDRRAADASQRRLWKDLRSSSLARSRTRR